MKPIFSFLLLLSLTVSSCKKEKEISPPPAKTYPDYSALKPGNYWIYERFDVDSNGNATPTGIYDSCYVEKDTQINGRTYMKYVEPHPYLNGETRFTYQI